MCWGLQLVSVCVLCRTRTPVPEIQWQGCHLELSEGESYPLCAVPTITTEVKEYSCQTCLTEADDGHNAEDLYPEPPHHPGFPLPKAQINLSQVRLPAPTAYETIQNMENLAGSANELPSYIDTMNDLPSAPDYALGLVRAGTIHRANITFRVQLITASRLQELRPVADRRRQQIHDFRNRVGNLDVSIANLLTAAENTIDSILSEREESVSRVASLHEGLQSVESEINFEGPHYPSPSEMVLLEHQRQAIVRELDERYIQNYMIPTAEQWDLRLQGLQDHILAEWCRGLGS